VAMTPAPARPERTQLPVNHDACLRQLRHQRLQRYMPQVKLLRAKAYAGAAQAGVFKD
jgi:hypothetical protein